MRTMDLSPLYRSMIGFDRLASLIDAASRAEGSDAYPPFNIQEIGEDAYRVEIAVAGFAEDELSVEVKENALTIAGRKDDADEEGRRFLHRGIAARAFERRFQLADHVVVTGAKLENGLLSIELQREIPEAKKPRRIAIRTEAGSNANLIEDAEAA